MTFRIEQVDADSLIINKGGITVELTHEEVEACINAIYTAPRYRFTTHNRVTEQGEVTVIRANVSGLKREQSTTDRDDPERLCDCGSGVSWTACHGHPEYGSSLCG